MKLNYIKLFEEFVDPASDIDDDTELQDVVLGKGKIDLSDGLKYLLAGKCIATFENKSNRSHLTYLVKKCKGNENLFFVSGLTGPDNENHFRYLGTIRLESNNAVFAHGKKSLIDKNSKIVISFQAILPILVNEYNNRLFLAYKNGAVSGTHDIKKAFIFKEKIIDGKNGKKIKLTATKRAQKFIEYFNLKDCTISYLMVGDVKMAYIQKNSKITNLEFWHSSKCSRCGRPLTVADSISAGMGNICVWLASKEAAAKMGF
jgi:hypothetical protein